MKGPAAREPVRGGLMRRGLVGFLVLAGMGAAAAIGGYAVLLLTVRGQEVTVPDLDRMTQAEAEAAAAARELTVEVAGTRVEPRVGEGRVFQQDPPAGASTRPRRAIRVLLSLGQATLAVPQLVGAPIRKVQLTLEQMGLRVASLAYADSLDQPVDGVLAQRPPAGALRQKGDAVSLLVSRGRAERIYVMPAFKGAQARAAEALLKDIGVRVGYTRRAAGPEGGIVLDQSPREGYPLRERQTVQLVVSQ